MKKIGWLILIFAVLYVTWHLGRYYEAGQPVKMVFCSPTEDPEYLSCMTVTTAARDAEKLYQEFMSSMGEPEDLGAGPVAGKLPVRGF